MLKVLPPAKKFPWIHMELTCLNVLPAFLELRWQHPGSCKLGRWRSQTTYLSLSRTTLIHIIHQYALKFRGQADQILLVLEQLALGKEQLQLLEPMCERERELLRELERNGTSRYLANCSVQQCTDNRNDIAEGLAASSWCTHAYVSWRKPSGASK